jgi:DNA-directed RNA polymerase subunit N (RpoN/RPB10)
MGYPLIAQDVDEYVARASGHRISPLSSADILHDLTETRHCDRRIKFTESNRGLFAGPKRFNRRRTGLGHKLIKRIPFLGDA